MEAKTKALIAAVVVLALALSAVSGVTYSWFSDSESGTVNVSTATVDIDGLTIDGQAVSDSTASIQINDIVPNMSKKVVIEANNNSTYDIQYRVYAVYDGDGSLTPYDLKNVNINADRQAFTLASGSDKDDDMLAADRATLDGDNAKVFIIKGWTHETTISTSFTIQTPEDYGGSVSAPVVAYNTTDGNNYGDGLTASDVASANQNSYASWSPETSKSFSLKIVVQAVQGDYVPAAATASATNGVATLSKSTSQVTAVLNTVSDTSANGTVASASVVFGSSTSSSFTGSDKLTITAGASQSSFTVDGTSATVSLSFDGDKKIADNDQATVTVKIKGTIADPVVIYTGEGRSQPTVTGYYYTTENDIPYTVVTFKTSHFSDFLVAENGISVSDVSSLAKAVLAGADVVLGSDLTVDDLAASLGTVSRVSSVIDLDGHKLINNGTAAVVIDNGASLTIKNGDLVTSTTGSNAAFYINNGSSLILNGVDYDAQDGTALYPRGDASSVMVINSSISAGVYAIGTNSATVDNYGVVITVKNSELETSTTNGDNTTVLINVDGNLNISNSVLKGDRQCLVVRAGTALVSNTQFIFDSSFDNSSVASTRNGGTWASGNEVASAAIVVGDRTPGAYYADASLTLSGCSVSVAEDAKQTATLVAYRENGTSTSSTAAYNGQTYTTTVVLQGTNTGVMNSAKAYSSSMTETDLSTITGLSKVYIDGSNVTTSTSSVASEA